MAEAVQVREGQQEIDLPFPSRTPIEVRRTAVEQLQMFAMNANHFVENPPVDTGVRMLRLAPADIEEQLVHIPDITHVTEAHPHVDIAARVKIRIEQAGLVEGCLPDHAEAGDGTGQPRQHDFSPCGAFADFRVAAHEKTAGQWIHEMVATLPAWMNESYARVPCEAT